MSTLITEWGVDAMKRGAPLAVPSAERIAGANFVWDALNLEATLNRAIFVFGTMPESDLYTASQNVTIEICWISDNASVGDVRWITYLLGRSAGEAWDVAFPAGTPGTSSRTAGNALHVLSITNAAPALSPGDDFIFQILRWAQDAGDTYPVDADLVRVRMYI